MEIIAAMDHAVAATAELVKAVRPADLDGPTPCAEWHVRALLSHVVGTLWLGEALLADTAPRVPIEPGGLPDGDVLAGDPAAAYAAAASAMLAAAGRGDAVLRTHATPLGEMPGPVLAESITLDIAVHGWDLARATGQPATLEDELAAHVLAFAEQALTDERRGLRMAPSIPTSPAAPVTDRLVAFLGRRP